MKAIRSKKKEVTSYDFMVNMCDVAIFTFVLEHKRMMIGKNNKKKSLVGYGEIRYILKELVKKKHIRFYKLRVGELSV